MKSLVLVLSLSLVAVSAGWWGSGFSEGRSAAELREELVTTRSSLTEARARVDVAEKAAERAKADRDAALELSEIEKSIADGLRARANEADTSLAEEREALESQWAEYNDAVALFNESLTELRAREAELVREEKFLAEYSAELAEKGHEWNARVSQWNARHATTQPATGYVPATGTGPISLRPAPAKDPIGEKMDEISHRAHQIELQLQDANRLRMMQDQ